jgi:hypothetical protein
LSRRLHIAFSAVLGTFCQLASGQEPGATTPPRGAGDQLAIAREGLPKAASEPRGTPVRSLPASAPKTVAERKAETLEAMRKGQMVPAGHGSPAPAP